MPQRESIHLASSHPPFDTRIFHKECKTLAAAGYAVTLIVPHERDEVVDGVRIQAVSLPRDGRERLFKTLHLIYRTALAASPDAVFHFHDAELIFHMFLLKLHGRTVVYDAHEDTPRQVMYQHWIPKAMRKPMSVVMNLAERLGGAWFDGIIAAEPGILQRFPERRTRLIHNFPIRDELIQGEGKAYAERPPHITYIGSISEVRGVREMVRAMQLLTAYPEAKLMLGGAFHPAGLEAEVRAMTGSERVVIEGWLRREQVAEVLAQTRIGIVTLHPTPKYVDSYPTKLFEYMSAGIPVIASNFPGWRKFVEEAECGLLVDPMDPDAIRQAIQYLLDHPHEAEAMGRRGQQAIAERYNWAHEAQQLLAFYEALPKPTH